MPLKTTQDDQLQLNLTPMIDVLFLLIIFFMVATKFTELERNIEVELPEVATAGEHESPREPRTVTVYADGRIALDGESLSRVELVERLTAARRASPDVEVMLNGDANCPFQHVADTLAACHESEIHQIGIAVELATAMSQPANTRK
ncbi:ExbD/TolR family protein [Aeoliella mucimassa]|uniref:Biopolymer transport protein ExbD n=1 Tax=Aeoliella mucimassa TaxID=2527972 RepID=A0A518AN99_9BACT|nr:biopolymer transporter ExbD [Aeoliella mucimassa]QDU56198.1 Biopolymer transport protein ExbD [Aeoliella mucimassa]